MPPSLVLRPAAPADEAAWRGLWRGYCDFYEAIVPEAVTATTWARILDPQSAVSALVAETEAGLAGFANFVVHPYTWSERPACYLEDLYVDLGARGRGIGKALIEALLAEGRRQGWGRLYWMTRADNAAARRLYDRFTPKDDFVRYLVAID